ncbi:probable aquaporin NIP-type [Beta vulgaris subsp. vulgaris]|uniref:probable aquaporin NIP-type n=1 Tax=Beta vulgaris subsp. vulgaris TaxID=3555 RepID=UPI0020370DD6|nr:probable aquaporin NIP-type [Beta vulgaris subsp. vulgaris]
MSSKVSHVDDVELSKMEEGSVHGKSNQPTTINVPTNASSSSDFSVILATILQKLLAEFIGTYLIVFTGCAAIIVEKTKGEITYPGICVTWGLIIMIVVYTLEHVSCHFNPSVTITYALLRGFPWKQVPFYIGAQIMGSIFASGTLYLLLDVPPKAYFGNLPSGSDAQAVVMEIIISFILMFVIFGTAFDERAHNQFAGVAIGMTVLMNALIAGTISGASMNPARSIGPAIIMHVYKGLWIYIVGPTIGCILGGITYISMRYMDQVPSKVTSWSNSFEKKFVNWFSILKGKFFDAFHKVH